MVLIPYYFSRKYNASIFFNFFSMPQPLCLERRSIGNDVPFALVRTFSFLLLSDRDRPRLNTTGHRNRPLDLGSGPRISQEL